MRTHWDTVYTTKPSDRVSWYAPHLATSLALIEGTGVARDARVIDVGGGASTLVDDLLARGYRDLAVLDLSAEALAVARARLGARAEGVAWIVGDVTQLELAPASVAVWHDRAVFHFLTDPEARRRYVARVRHAVRPGGHVIVATFGPHGPERCSGLEVARYDAEGLHAAFGAPFVRIASSVEQHTTPWGSEQEFVYCYCRREADQA